MEALIRSAKPQDAEAIAALLRDSIAELCEADHGRDEAILSAWLRNKNATSVRRWLDSPNSSTLVAEHANGLAGVGMLSRNGQILLLYVAPEAASRGIGSRLLDSLLEVAAEWGLELVHSHSTATAREFYLRHGFEPAGEPVREAGLVGYPLQFVRSACNRRSPG